MSPCHMTVSPASSSSILITHCLFLRPSSIPSAPGITSFLLDRDKRSRGLGDLSEELSSSQEAFRPTGVQDVVPRNPESSSWGCILTVCACAVRSSVVLPVRSPHPPLEEVGVSSSQTHSSLSLPQFIWMSWGSGCSVTRSLWLFFNTSLNTEVVGWFRENLLLRPKNRPPPLPPRPCSFILLVTAALPTDSSESSELPSYGSKH